VGTTASAAPEASLPAYGMDVVPGLLLNDCDKSVNMCGPDSNLKVEYSAKHNTTTTVTNWVEEVTVSSMLSS